MSIRTGLALLGCMLVLAAVARAEDATSVRPRPIHEILFSIEEPPPPPTDDTTAEALDPTEHPELVDPAAAPTDPSGDTDVVELPPPFGHGALASERGVVVASNAQLLRNFHPMPTTEPVDYGLDAVQEFIRLSSDGERHRRYLFSIERGFFDEVLGVRVGHGDLLSDAGNIVARNARLLANFHPQPVDGSLGLDAVAIMRPDQPVAEAAMPVVWFSTERSFFDEERGVPVSHGDLLSTTGRIVARNRWLLRNFKPVVPDDHPAVWYDADGTRRLDFGLDAVFVPLFNRRLNSEDKPPVLWFSTEWGFYDVGLGRWVKAGDLLSTTGRIVRTNWQLLKRFYPPPPEDAADGTGDDSSVRPPRNLGLDAVDARIVRADFNLDGAVDLSDYGEFLDCYRGVNAPISDACAIVDLDEDEDVDLADYTGFLDAYTGPIVDNEPDEP